MAGVKSVQMFHDVFHENSVNNKEDREGLTKLFKWNIHVKNNMIINCVDWKDVNKNTARKYHHKRQLLSSILHPSNL